ncbi:hypothetical protein [Parasphingorhabdus pacifica]
MHEKERDQQVQLIVVLVIVSRDVAEPAVVRLDITIDRTKVSIKTTTTVIARYAPIRRP